MIPERRKLHSERQRLERQADAIFAAADAEKQRDLTAQELRSLDAITFRKNAIDARLHQLDAERDAAGRAWDEGNPEASGGRGVFTGPRFAQMFPAAAHDARGWESLGEFVQAASNRLADPRLFAADGGNIGVPSEGGFMVPTQFYAELLDLSLESEIVRPRARIVPMRSDKIEAPIWDKYDRSGGAPFGFSIRWMAETATGAKQKPSLAAIGLNAKKCAIYCPASNEMVADGVGFEDQLREGMSVSMSWGLDDAFLNGDGAGKPLGVFNSASLITVDKESGQAADTVIFENLAKMAARHRNYANATWVVSQTAMPQLLTLSIPIGTAGSHIPVLTKNAGQFEILQRPVIFTEKLQPVGDLGDILLADFNQYVIGLRQDADFAKSEHALFDTDETFFRIVSRLDGMPIDASADTPKNGDTLSAFVTLAARA